MLTVLPPYSEGRVYYFNPYTKESQWDLPTEPARGAAKGKRLHATVCSLEHELAAPVSSMRHLERVLICLACGDVRS